MGAKRDVRPHAHRVPQAHLQASGHGRVAAKPYRIDHALIENRSQDASMDDARESLKAFGNEESGAHSRCPLKLELQVEAMRVIFAADETTVIILEFHGGHTLSRLPRMSGQ